MQSSIYIRIVFANMRPCVYASVCVCLCVRGQNFNRFKTKFSNEYYANFTRNKSRR